MRISRPQKSRLPSPLRWVALVMTGSALLIWWNASFSFFDVDSSLFSSRERTSLSSLTDPQEDANMVHCLKQVLDYLPIGHGWKRNRSERLAVYTHHYDANNKKWNEEIRLEHMPQLEAAGDKCSVWEVGAHKDARDSKILMPKYPKCKFHAFEPIPDFHQALSRKWEKDPRMTTHGYGLAAKDSKFFVTPESIQGQATFIGESKEGSIEATIKSFDYAVQDAGGKPTLMHVNCEGCEWTMIPEAVETGLIQDIPILQLGTHNYGTVGLGARGYQLCEIHAMLNRTHRMVNGVPFGWERWVLR